MPSHTTINGRTIEYEPTAEEQRFLTRVESAIDDLKISEVELRALIYGPENPMLDQQAGYTFVTPSSFESPVFRVMLDLLDRKRARTGSLDVERAAERYTLSVLDAAKQLGIRESAVRVAVVEGRLPSWMRDGQIRLSPESVASYEVSRRGRPPRLSVVCGSKDGASLRIGVIGGKFEKVGTTGGLVEGQVTTWERVGVITGARRTSRDGAKATTYRYWLLQPGGKENSVGIEPLKVTGRFTIASELNGKAASEAFSALKGQEREGDKG